MSYRVKPVAVLLSSYESLMAEAATRWSGDKQTKLIDAANEQTMIGLLFNIAASLEKLAERTGGRNA